MPIDITDKYIRIRQKDPGQFARMITKTLTAGIKAIIGFYKGKSGSTVQSYLFNKDKFTLDTAKAWVKKHDGNVSESFKYPEEAGIFFLKEYFKGYEKYDDSNRVFKVVTKVMESAGYVKKGDTYIKEALIMLKKNLEAKLKHLMAMKESNRHVVLIQEAGKLLKGHPSDEDIKGMISKVDKSINHCVEIAKSKIPANDKTIKEGDISGDFISLKEAQFDDEKREAVITIISPGFNKSKKRYYSPKLLESSAKMFEGLKMYKNHLTEAEEKKLDGQPRSVDEWTSSIKETWYDNMSGSIKGRAKIHNQKFWEFAKSAKDEIGTSINAFGKMIQGTIEGVSTNIVEAFTKAKSVDWVTEAGAGGKLDQILETEEGDIKMLETITEEKLLEHRADLVEKIKADAIKEHESKKGGNEMDEKEVKEMKDENERLTNENTELTKFKETNEAEKNKAAIQVKVEESLKDVKDIPVLSIAKVKESLKALDCKPEEVSDKVKEAVKSERDYLLSLKKAGSNIEGLGETKEGEEKGDKTDEEKKIAEVQVSHDTAKKMGHTATELKEMYPEIYKDNK